MLVFTSLLLVCTAQVIDVMLSEDRDDDGSGGEQGPRRVAKSMSRRRLGSGVLSRSPIGLGRSARRGRSLGADNVSPRVVAAASGAATVAALAVAAAAGLDGGDIGASGGGGADSCGISSTCSTPRASTRAADSPVPAPQLARAGGSALRRNAAAAFAAAATAAAAAVTANATNTTIATASGASVSSSRASSWHRSCPSSRLSASNLRTEVVAALNASTAAAAAASAAGSAGAGAAPDADCDGGTDDGGCGGDCSPAAAGADAGAGQGSGRHMFGSCADRTMMILMPDGTTHTLDLMDETDGSDSAIQLSRSDVMSLATWHEDVTILFADSEWLLHVQVCLVLHGMLRRRS